mmetsp:Transcript_2882/g.4939  ORF Transcript_2882/g.4939 Transcript_2882/m.4939 type:complete len:236 (+) Transcript_2882:76-783(+)
MSSRSTFEAISCMSLVVVGSSPLNPTNMSACTCPRSSLSKVKGPGSERPGAARMSDNGTIFVAKTSSPLVSSRVQLDDGEVPKIFFFFLDASFFISSILSTSIKERMRSAAVASSAEITKCRDRLIAKRETLRELRSSTCSILFCSMPAPPMLSLIFASISWAAIVSVTSAMGAAAFEVISSSLRLALIASRLPLRRDPSWVSSLTRTTQTKPSLLFWPGAVTSMSIFDVKVPTW